MKHFIADIGSWEKGKTEPFIAETRTLAVLEAFKIREKKYPLGDVVSIREKVGENQYQEFWCLFKGRTDDGSHE